MPNIDLSILNQRQTPAFYASSLATRPAFGFAGRIFIDTDSPSTGLYRDTGSAWVQIADPGAGTTGTLQQVTTNGKTTNQGITITAGGLSSNIVNIDENSLSTSTNYVGQTMPGLDFWRIYGTGAVSDQTEMVFLVGDNGSSYASGIGQRFRFSYDATASGTAKNALIVDYDSSNFNTNLIVSSGNNLGVGVSVPSGLIHADGGASAARMIIDADNGIARIFSFRTDNLPRWALRVDGTETGSNVGGDFSIRRYDDTGAFVDAPLLITRSTGQSTFAKKVVIENNAGDQQLQIVSTTAPSLRIDNLQTGATKRAGLGLATTVNNFIQGSVDRDFCVFNSSTTASPILFGIYDAGLTNTQEAARITATRNFNVGSNIDSGFKLYVKAGASGLLLSAGTTSSDNALLIQNSAETITLLNIKGNGAATFTSTIRTGNAVIPGFAGANDIALPNNMALRGANAANATGFSLIKLNTSDQVAINSDGATAVTISGNTLLGTGTDSGERLQVSGSIKSILTSTTAVPTIFTENNVGSITRLRSYGTSATGTMFGVSVAGYSSFDTNNGLGLLFGTTDASAPIIIGTNNAERMRIKANGVINISGIPTSAVGLSSGDIYSNAGILTIVP